MLIDGLITTLATAPTVELRVPRATDPHGYSVFMSVIALCVFAFALWVWWKRRRLEERDGVLRGIRTVVCGAAIGNALLDLNAMLQPERPDAAVIVRLEHEDECDTFGDGREVGAGPGMGRVHSGVTASMESEP